MDNVEKLKGMILETVKGGVAEVKTEMEKVNETVSKLKEEVDTIKDMPAKKIEVGAPGEEKHSMLYNGFNLNYQGRSIREDAFRLLDENLKQDIAKMLINAVSTGLSGKPEYKINTTMSEGTAGSGGYLVFDEFLNVIRSLGELYGVGLAEAEVVPMNTDKLHYPVDNDKSITVASKSETTAYSDGVPSDIVTEIELSATRIGAYGVLTNQLLEDSSFDIVGFLLPKFAAAISRKIDYEMFTSGASVFDPLVDDSNLNDSTGTLDIAHLLDAYKYLDARMRPGAKFYFHRIVHYGTILNQTDTAGNAIFPPNMTNMGKSLWDIPVVLAEDIPYTLTNGSLVGLCGNMRQAYVIGMRKGVGSFFFNPYSLDTSEQTRITLGTRWDGVVGFGKAMTKLTY